MAGKPRLGLEYYRVSSNRINEAKMQVLINRQGCEGYVAYDVLLQLIFINGPFYKFSNRKEIEEYIEIKTKCSTEQSIKILTTLLDLNLFDSVCFSRGYLTNKDIQSHYYFATKKRKTRYLEECDLLTQVDKDFIDSGSDYNDILVNSNGISVDLNDILDSSNEHSNSKRKRNKKIKKDKSMINHDIFESIDSSTLPFKAHYYLKVLIDNEVIKGTEEFIEHLNDLLYKLSQEYEKDEVRDAVYYTIKMINSHGFIGENGIEIFDHYLYLEKALMNNCSRAKRNKEPFEWPL